MSESVMLFKEVCAELFQGVILTRPQSSGISKRLKKLGFRIETIGRVRSVFGLSKEDLPELKKKIGTLSPYRSKIPTSSPTPIKASISVSKEVRQVVDALNALVVENANLRAEIKNIRAALAMASVNARKAMMEHSG